MQAASWNVTLGFIFLKLGARFRELEEKYLIAIFIAAFPLPFHILNQFPNQQQMLVAHSLSLK